MPNPFDYLQLVSTDPEKAKNFYRALFDWQVEDAIVAGNMVQTIIKQPQGPWGGIMGATGKGVQSMWHVYVQVTNIDLALLRVAQLGGKVIVPKTPVPNTGFIAFIQDPTGATLGLSQRLSEAALSGAEA
jgi:predicted enzyme related to lactoylglutathione lyase